MKREKKIQYIFNVGVLKKNKITQKMYLNFCTAYFSFRIKCRDELLTVTPGTCIK